MPARSRTEGQAAGQGLLPVLAIPGCCATGAVRAGEPDALAGLLQQICRQLCRLGGRGVVGAGRLQSEPLRHVLHNILFNVRILDVHCGMRDMAGTGPRSGLGGRRAGRRRVGVKRLCMRQECTRLGCCIGWSSTFSDQAHACTAARCRVVTGPGEGACAGQRPSGSVTYPHRRHRHE